MKIRKAVGRDVIQIYRIGKKIKEFKVSSTSSLFWSRKQLSGWIKSKEDIILIGEENKKMIGFILVVYHKPTRKAQIENIWVSRNERRRTLGSKLLREALKQLKNRKCKYVSLLINTRNQKAISFHLKNKFNKGHSFYWMDMGL